MITVTQWLNKRKQHKAHEAYTAGYDYAAGRLLRSTAVADTKTVLADLTALSLGEIDDTWFDAGIRAAMTRWHHVVQAKDFSNSYRITGCITGRVRQENGNEQ